MIYCDFKYSEYTFFEHVAYGKAILFDPNDKLENISLGQERRIIKRISEAVLEFFDSFERIQEYENTELERDRITIYMRYVFNQFVFRKTMSKLRKKHRTSFLELYDLTINELIKKFYRGYFKKYVDQELIERTVEEINNFNFVIKKVISREVLHELIKRYKGSIIIVVNEFYKEFLYRISPHVKGFVIRNVECRNEIVEYAYAYEIPMVQSSIDISYKDNVIIDNPNNKLLVNPEKKELNAYIKQIKSIVFTKEEESNYHMNRIRFYAPVVDDRYLNILENTNYYYGLGMFRSEYIYLVKGMLPTEDELVELMIKFVETFKDREVIFRVPDFGEFKILDYYSFVKTNINSQTLGTYVFTTFFEALEKTIKITKAKINIVVPMIRDFHEIEGWNFRLKYYFREIPKESYPEIGYMIETDSFLMDIESYVKEMDFNVIGLNDLIEEISEDFTRYDIMPWKDFREEIYPDIQYAHQVMRRNGIFKRHLISGNTFRDELVFQKLINAGFLNYIIPIYMIRLAQKLLIKYETSRGKFVGVAVERRLKRQEKEKAKKIDKPIKK